MTTSIAASELDILVAWIKERESVRQKKEAGQPKPWTNDQLLLDYRWCNVRRMDDRVSRWLMENWYGKEDRAPYDDLALAALARLVNWPDTLAEIRQSSPPWDRPIATFAMARDVMRQRAERGQKVFTGAYVVPGIPGVVKHESVIRTAEHIADHSDEIYHPQSMRRTWRRLCELDRIGSFLAGQMVADMAHLDSGRAWADKARWAPLGPGSMRGMNRVIGRPVDHPLSQDHFEFMLLDLIDEIGPRIEDIWRDRDLHAMDMQNCLCEFDKYRRLTLKEGKVRARYDGRGQRAGLIT